MKEGASEQSNMKSEAEVMPIEDFSNLSLTEMEQKLSAKAKADDQSEQNSEASEEVSITEETTEVVESQDNEEASEDTVVEESESEVVVEDKQKKKVFDHEKAYKELLPEYTRSRQQIKALEDRLNALESNKGQSVKPEVVTKPVTESNKKLAQLKETSPETADFIQELVKELVDEQVVEKIKPVEEQVTRNNQKTNIDAFTKATQDFRNSELAPLETQLVEIINENPKWQERILNDPNAFSEIQKELVVRHLDEVVKLKSKSPKAAKLAQKQRDIEKADVGGKPNKSGGVKPTDEMSEEEFSTLSLAEMEKRLPKHKR